MQYWFKRRRYGYGWAPVTWQAWAVVIGAIIAIILGALFIIGDREDPSSTRLISFFTYLLFCIALLVTFTVRHAPPGKWRWGKKPNDNPKEDW